jgi:methylated-DNA-[protein]-cysteine S-methyltransferase
MTSPFLVATHRTPAGPFTLVVGPDGVCAGGFTDDADRALSLLGPRRSGAAAAAGVRVVDDAGDASKAVLAWCDGDVDAVLGVDLDLEGTDFQRTIWATLGTIPGGAPLTYTGLAAAAGRPTAVRAASRGCATNRVSLFVPCHRVVPAGGGVGGFLWGPDVKRAALAHESAAVRADSADPGA